MNDKTTNYNKYKTKNILKRIMVHKFMKKIKKLLSSYDEKTKLLDAGCGEGFISDYIYKNTKIDDITGIDINEASINYAKENNNFVKYYTFDINDLNEKKEKFDVVICLEVLEHLKYPEKILSKIKSVSTNKLIISVPREPFFSIGNFITFKNIKRFGRPKDHINIWTSKSFIKFLNDNNISNYEIKKTLFWIIVIIDV